MRKLLILESNWADDKSNYITDSSSTSRIYSSIESMLSVDEKPLKIIQRPLLACRFASDIELFTNLEENKKGVNIIILSAHGRFNIKKKKMKKVYTRELCAIDGEINISREIREVSSHLGRSIIILDSCSVGTNAKSFLYASEALGVIGFSKDVDWIDSAVFILALLSKFKDEGVFLLQRKSPGKPHKILEEMKTNMYSNFFDELVIEYCFR